MIAPNKIIRSNRKTLSICVTAEGQVIVRAPKQLSLDRIESFVLSKQKWLEKHVKRNVENSVALPRKSLDGYTFPLLGKECTVRLCEIKKPFFDEVEYKLYLPFEESEKEYGRIKKWLKSYAKSVILPLVERRAKQMKAAFTSLSITQAKTRWGSCSGKNRLNFSFRLIYTPLAVVDYVVVHELSHVFHKNHSAAFWNTVKTFCPEYKALRAYLKQKNTLMTLF